MKSLHLKMDSTDDRPYLDHTSYIDCSNIFEQDIATAIELMADAPTTHLGDLSEQDLQDVTEKIKNAKTIAPKLKKKYGFI
jgi:hypothetical protein